MSPIYPKLKEAGAVFEQVMGYERPTWFEPEMPKSMNILCNRTEVFKPFHPGTYGYNMGVNN